MEQLKNELIELNECELREIDGGSQRKDEKRNGWYGIIWTKILGLTT
ncbi:hypothetical protein ORI89_16220 [Sphingobacterium sp. UT-1RO-CII-1]|nr:hypothetical protein [Sphingobacterium sp. UT-1RO-CII-1]MCY4781209.1 hypothetical protein [Sphingobacterium sp. UT-1RO-CII-1]